MGRVGARGHTLPFPTLSPSIVGPINLVYISEGRGRGLSASTMGADRPVIFFPPVFRL